MYSITSCSSMSSRCVSVDLKGMHDRLRGDADGDKVHGGAAKMKFSRAVVASARDLSVEVKRTY